MGAETENLTELESSQNPDEEPEEEKLLTWKDLVRK